MRRNAEEVKNALAAANISIYAPGDGNGVVVRARSGLPSHPKPPKRPNQQPSMLSRWPARYGSCARPAHRRRRSIPNPSTSPAPPTPITSHPHRYYKRSTATPQLALPRK